MFKPDPIDDLTSEQVAEMFIWLDDVREGGKVNMFGAYPYLAEMFELSKPLARKVWAKWAETFAMRHGSAA